MRTKQSNIVGTSTVMGNHFEMALIIVAGHLAYDTGICTWVDDDAVAVEIQDDLLKSGVIKVFSRYADDRESDALPDGLTFVPGFQSFMDQVRGVEIEVTEPWRTR